MKNLLTPLGAALGLALLVTGCETDGITARTQEKSAVYATLKPWEKKDIAKGVIEAGFTPDMVYMAVGSPSKVQPTGASGELWTYRNYYPPADAAHMRYGTFNIDTPNQPLPKVTLTQSSQFTDGGQHNNFSGTSKESLSSFDTGAPQGGSMEPAALQSFTLYVLFQDGKVARLGIKPS